MGIALTAGKYVTWGVINVSVTNLVIVLVMIVVFILALVIPFPSGHERSVPPTSGEGREG